jgi:hypothetical protein
MSRRVILLVLAAVLAVSCGDSSSNGPTSSGVTVNFTGNDTCPSQGQQPYFSGALPVNSVPAVGQAVDEMPHNHVAPPAKVTYLHDPPTSGCHYNLGYGQAPVTAGAYDRVVEPERWVHNLEHGYIVVLYNCPSGCASEFGQLRTWLKGLSNDSTAGVQYPKVLILPETTMKAHFAVVCWDWYDPMDQLSISEVQKFFDNHVDNAPEGTNTP